MTLPTNHHGEVFWEDAARLLKLPGEGAAKAACQG